MVLLTRDLEDSFPNLTFQLLRLGCECPAPSLDVVPAVGVLSTRQGFVALRGAIPFHILRELARLQDRA
jgi:hypothetical protein